MDTTSSPRDAYRHEASGLIFPKAFDIFERETVTPGAPVADGVKVSYFSETRLSETLKVFLNATVSVVPNSTDAPTTYLNQLDAEFLTRHPGAKLVAPGAGNSPTSYITYDRPDWGDRAGFETYVVRRGKNLIVTSFVFLEVRRDSFRSAIDRFVKNVPRGS